MQHGLLLAIEAIEAARPAEPPCFLPEPNFFWLEDATTIALVHFSTRLETKLRKQLPTLVNESLFLPFLPMSIEH